MENTVSIQALDQVKTFVNGIMEKWSGKTLDDAMKFLFGSIDSLVSYVDTLIPTGEDKKQLVLNMAGDIYDLIIVSRLPFFLRVFSGQVKYVLINVLISYAIDFIVAKYRAGSWKVDATTKG
jgi:hypothetical protein